MFARTDWNTLSVLRCCGVILEDDKNPVEWVLNSTYKRYDSVLNPKTKGFYNIKKDMPEQNLSRIRFSLVILSRFFSRSNFNEINNLWMVNQTSNFMQ